MSFDAAKLVQTSHMPKSKTAVLLSNFYVFILFSQNIWILESNFVPLHPKTNEGREYANTDRFGVMHGRVCGEIDRHRPVYDNSRNADDSFAGVPDARVEP